jgi:hypothetical protein
MKRRDMGYMGYFPCTFYILLLLSNAIDRKNDPLAHYLLSDGEYTWNSKNRVIIEKHWGRLCLVEGLMKSNTFWYNWLREALVEDRCRY